MAEINLNKPLYSEGGGGKGPSRPGAGPSGPPAPRPARPALWMRIAALAIDLLLLHGVATLALKLFFEQVVALGVLGPFVGLLAGTFYFAFGYSALTSGRTVGKLVMRLQVADLRGGFDLSTWQGVLRALLLMWPLWIVAAVGIQVERLAQPEVLDPQPFLLQMAAIGVAAAWFIGNFFHSWYDPHGCSWIDRLVGSVEFSSDAPVEDVEVFLRSARERTDKARVRRALLALVACVVAILGLDAVLAYQAAYQFRIMTPEKREEMLAQRRVFAVTGFPLPVDLRADQEPSADDKATTGPPGVQFQYRRRGPLTLEELKGNPAVPGTLDRVTSAFTDEMRKRAQLELADQQKGTAQKPDEMAPQSAQARIQVGFAQHADLFFASQAVNVYSESRLLDLEAVRRSVQEPPAPGRVGEVTTGTAETTGTAQTETPGTGMVHGQGQTTAPGAATPAPGTAKTTVAATETTATATEKAEAAVETTGTATGTTASAEVTSPSL